MKNICIQLFKRIKYTKAFLKTLIVFLLISVTTILSGVAQMNEYTLDEFLGSFDTCTMFSTIIIIAFVSLTSGAEFKNKTIYYAIMNGHSRKEVFLGKFIGFLPYVISLSVVQCVILYSMFAFITPDTFSDTYVNNVILNSLAFTITYISYSILSLSFCFITRSAIGGIGGSLIIMIAFNIAFFLLNLTGIKLFSFELSHLFGMFLFRFLLKNTTDSIFQISSVFVYTFLSVCYLLTGYIVFRKEDLI